ncbi:MAG: CpXC domain-containing protein [Candidatus Flexifilum sp.]
MPRNMLLSCPNCRAQFPAAVESVIDPAVDPGAKTRLLSGRINQVRCPNCGAAFTVTAPILYHDAEKKLLLTYVPIELNLGKDASEKAIGDLMREALANIPNEKRGGYLFQPRQMLTMQGLIDAILEGDGISKEMIQAQKERVALIEAMLPLAEDALQAYVENHDAAFDLQFLQTLSLMIQRVAAEGQRELAERLLEVQEAVMAYSTVGQQIIEQSAEQEQIVREVTEALNRLGANGQPTRRDFLDLAIRYMEDEQRLQALVGLARPAFDYQFFEELTLVIGQAPADDRPGLELLRDHLLQLTRLVDEQARSALQAAADALQALIDSPDPDAYIADNLDVIDDAFMSVLEANIREAERRGDQAALARLKTISDKIMNALRANMQPELRFINELLAQPSAEAARTMIREQAAQYGQGLLAMFDAVEQALAARGSQEMLQRIAYLRQEAEAALR